MGGFASSPYLEARVRLALAGVAVGAGEALAKEVAVPELPYAAVLKGECSALSVSYVRAGPRLATQGGAELCKGFLALVAANWRGKAC